MARVQETRAYERALSGAAKEGKKIKEAREGANAAALFKLGQSAYDAMDTISATAYKSRVSEASSLARTNEEKAKNIDKIDHDTLYQRLVFPSTQIAKMQSKVTPKNASLLDKRKAQDIEERTLYGEFVGNRKKKADFEDYTAYAQDIKKQVKDKYGTLSGDFENQLNSYLSASKDYFTQDKTDEMITTNKYIDKATNSFLNGSKPINAESIVGHASALSQNVPSESANETFRTTLQKILENVNSPKLVDEVKDKLKNSNLENVMSPEEWTLYKSKAENSADIAKNTPLLFQERVINNVKKQNSMGIGVPIKGIILPPDVQTVNKFLIGNDVARMETDQIAALMASDDVMKMPEHERALVQKALADISVNLNNLANADFGAFVETLGLNAEINAILIPNAGLEVLNDSEMFAMKIGILERFTQTYNPVRNVTYAGDPAKNNIFTAQEKTALKQLYKGLNSANRWKLASELYGALRSQDAISPSKTDFGTMFQNVFGDETLKTYLDLSESYHDEMQNYFIVSEDAKKLSATQHKKVKTQFDQYLNTYLDKNLYPTSFRNGISDILTAEMFKEYAENPEKEKTFFNLDAKDLQIASTVNRVVDQAMLDGRLPFYVQKGRQEFKPSKPWYLFGGESTASVNIGSRAANTMHGYVAKSPEVSNTLNQLLNARNLDGLYVFDRKINKYVALNADPALKGRSLSHLLSNFGGSITNYNGAIDNFDFGYSGSEKDSLTGNYNKIYSKVMAADGNMYYEPFTVSVK